MEDQKLGKHCQIKECRQIDWMPMGCKYCSGTFCCEHYSIENHSCKEIEKNFKKVIQCPFCLEMLNLTQGYSPEETLSIHEAMSCQGKPKVNTIVCARPKCPTKITEINKFVCKTCDQTVCMKHRLASDHTCVSAAKRHWMGVATS